MWSPRIGAGGLRETSVQASCVHPTASPRQFYTEPGTLRPVARMHPSTHSSESRWMSAGEARPDAPPAAPPPTLLACSWPPSTSEPPPAPAPPGSPVCDPECVDIDARSPRRLAVLQARPSNLPARPSSRPSSRAWGPKQPSNRSAPPPRLTGTPRGKKILVARLPSANLARSKVPQTLAIVELAPQEVSMSQMAPIRLAIDVGVTAPRKRPVPCVVDPFCVFP